MLFIKKLKTTPLLVGLDKLEIGKKSNTVEFHSLKVMRNFVRPNDVEWPSGRGDNYPETYRCWF